MTGKEIVAKPPEAGRIFRSSGYLLWAAMAGMLASASLPPLGIFPAIFALSIPALAMAKTDRGRAAFLTGWAAGFGWFLLSLSWVSVAFVTSGGGHVFLIPFAALGLPLLLGVFWGAGFLLAWRLRPDPAGRVLALAAGLALMEYAKGKVLSGFPWNSPGMIILADDRALAVSAFIGIWGAGLLAIFFALLPAFCWLRQFRWAGLVLFLLLAFFGLGTWHHAQPLGATGAAGMTVRLVQPNIPQQEKWNKAMRPAHLDRLISLSRQPTHPAPDLIIWPETAFAGFIDRETETFRATIAAASGGVTPVVTGALGLAGEKEFRLYNSAFLIRPDGEVAARYDKTRLVPFGEYAPARDYLPFVEAIAGPVDFSPGKGPAGFRIIRPGKEEAVILAPLICYEIIFPGLVREMVAATGADMLVTITNDAWFGDTIGPRQHLAMARLRAAELGMPVLRVANTGISAAIDSHGRISDQIRFGETGKRDVVVGAARDTFYRRHGDVFWWCMLAATCIWVFAGSILTLRKGWR